MKQTFVIIGAGQSGAWIALTLRSEGFEGRIVLIGTEAHAPYERPPLSKAVLMNAANEGATTLLSAEEAAERHIELWLATSVTEIDRSARTVLCDDGREVVYDRLFLTMGSEPRWPDWAPTNSKRIHKLRTLDDAARLRSALATSHALVIVGGGWIGLEVAASARKMGMHVAIYEAADRLCARSLPPSMSAWLTELHSTRAVSLALAASVIGVTEGDNGVSLHLSDGRTAKGDQLLIGIGNVPNTALAATAGLEVANGIIVDATGRTSDRDIYAAGDVTSFPCSLAGPQTRRESWANAQNQAIVAAKAALGQIAEYDEIPWLWSDQYDANIQMLGIPEKAKSLLLKPGKEEGTGCWLALDAAGIPIGAIAINAGREIRAARKLIQRKQPVTDVDW
jgi:3-phenylpropionate/trans-cinnamate dioxygenase ferredoxin reductase subunit